MKQILFSVVFIITFVEANAQNLSHHWNLLPFWRLTGNNNATSSSKLGTTNAVNLRLFTNNLERMRINTAGDVGISSRYPSAKLQVNGSTDKSPFKVRVNGVTKLVVDTGGGVAIGSLTTPPVNGLSVDGNVEIGIITHSYYPKLNVETTDAFGIYTAGKDFGLISHADNNTAIYGYGGGLGVNGWGTLYGVYGYSNDGNGGYFY